MKLLLQLLLTWPNRNPSKTRPYSLVVFKLDGFACPPRRGFM